MARQFISLEFLDIVEDIGAFFPDGSFIFLGHFFK